MVKRFRYKRKRRTFRRKFKRRRVPLSRRKIIDMLSPPRTWHYEEDRSANLVQNEYYWIAPTSHASCVDLELAWKDLGKDSAALVSTTPNDTERAILKRAALDIELTNLNTHPMHVQVYWCIARDRQTNGDGHNPHVKVIEYLYNGWNDRMLAADVAAVLGYAGAGSNNISSKVASTDPMQAYRLRMAFKVKRGKGGWIKPGGIVNFKWNTYGRDRAIRYEIIKDDSNHKSVPGLTVVPLFRVQMMTGVDTGAASVFRPMDGYLHMKIYKKITYKFVDLKPALMAVQNSKSVAAITGDLVGPTEYADLADE